MLFYINEGSLFKIEQHFKGSLFEGYFLFYPLGIKKLSPTWYPPDMSGYKSHCPQVHGGYRHIGRLGNGRYEIESKV